MEMQTDNLMYRSDELDMPSEPEVVSPPSQMPINPAVSRKTVEAFTIVFIGLYGLLFVFIYIQLLLVLYFRYKRFSYQTVFLFLCLLWAGLRTTLFSFFVKEDTLPPDTKCWFLHWVLYSLPVCLQYTILCLLVLYFAQVVLKAKVRFEPDQYRSYKWKLRLVVLCLVILFLGVNLSCAIVISKRMYISPVVTARVFINGFLFTISSLVLSVCIWKIWRMSSANVLLEARGISVCQASTACVIIVLVFATRAFYNTIAVTCQSVKCPKFGDTWLYVSDEADLVNELGDFKFILFGIVLFIWEFLPTLVVILFFRVKCSNGTVPEVKLAGNITQRAYFFDDPRRYDSDEDLTRSANNYTFSKDNSRDTPSLGSTPLNTSTQAGYGTLIRSSSYNSSHNMPGTTPPMLFSGNISLGGYQNQTNHNRIFD